jgi:hypothetical protein
MQNSNPVAAKVIIDKSCGVVSILEQDTIKNVSYPIKDQKEFFLNFLRENKLSSFYATF